jgi:hypothetical protein
MIPRAVRVQIAPNESFLKPKNCCDIVGYGDITSSAIVGNLSIYMQFGRFCDIVKRSKVS